jgi:hypothetical protein
MLVSRLLLENPGKHGGSNLEITNEAPCVLFLARIATTPVFDFLRNVASEEKSLIHFTAYV